MASISGSDQSWLEIVAKKNQEIEALKAWIAELKTQCQDKQANETDFQVYTWIKHYHAYGEIDHWQWQEYDNSKETIDFEFYPNPGEYWNTEQLWNEIQKGMLSEEGLKSQANNVVLKKFIFQNWNFTGVTIRVSIDDKTIKVVGFIKTFDW